MPCIPSINIFSWCTWTSHVHVNQDLKDLTQAMGSNFSPPGSGDLMTSDAARELMSCEESGCHATLTLAYGVPVVGPWLLR